MGDGQAAGEELRRPEHAFARRYTPADVALLAKVDRAMGTVSGPATACVLRRQRDVFKVPRSEWLGDISVAHLYNLRRNAGYSLASLGLSSCYASHTQDS